MSLDTEIRDAERAVRNSVQVGDVQRLADLKRRREGRAWKNDA